MVRMNGILRPNLRPIGLTVASTLVSLDAVGGVGAACVCVNRSVVDCIGDCKGERGKGYRKAVGGGGTCVVMAQWDHYCSACKYRKLTD